MADDNGIPTEKPSWWPPDQPWPPGSGGADENASTTMLPPPPTSTTENKMTRGELRDFLKFFTGQDLPATAEDLYNAANSLKGLLSVQGQFASIPFFGGALAKGIQPFIVRAARTLQAYGMDYFGSQAPQAQSAYAIFSELMRPPQPSVEKKQTAEEFLGDFDQGFRQSVEGLRTAGKITGKEAEFAYNNLRTKYLNAYLADLGKFAEAGQSPFALQEVTRAERGIAEGTTAGNAVTAALGKGVEEPTRIRKEISTTAAPGATGAATAGAQVEQQATALREQVENIGQGVPKEFISLPRVMPMTFLEGKLSATTIKLAYAGSEEGGGRTTRASPGGFASSTRRV